MANQIDTDAKVIAGDNYGFGHPAICRLSNTVMLAAHINQSDELEIHKSIDNGLNWTLKKSLPNASGCFNFVVINPSRAAIVYQKNNNEFEVWVDYGDAGENWSNKLDLTTGILSNNKALLLYDSNLGRLHIIWQGTSYFYGKYSDNNGVDWTIWTSSSLSDNLADVDINLSNNYIYVSHFYGATTNNYYYWYDSFGTYKGNTGNLGTAGNTYYDKNLAIDSAGNRYFAYVRNNTSGGYEKLEIHRNEGSATILFYPGVGVPIIVKGSTSIGIDEDDNVYVYYTKTSDEKTYYRKYDAGTATWEAEVELIADANVRINTEKHVLAGSNKLHFCYYKQP